MTVVDSIKIAFLVALFGRELQERLEPLSHADRDIYGVASRKRLVRWDHKLRAVRESDGDGSGIPIPLFEEIFLAEPLTRVWAAVHSSRGDVTNSSNSPQKIFLQHMDVRGRAIKILTSDNSASARYAASFEKLRRQSERWSDLALACLQSRLIEGLLAPQDYMIDVRRAEDYGFVPAQNRFSENDPCLEREGEQIAGLLKGLEAAYPRSVSSKDDSTRHINETVMDCLQGLIPLSNAARIAFWHCRIDQASDIMV